MLFELRDVVYRYPEVTALAGVSLSVAAGERVVILGANGSGKSTLLHLLDGLCFPDQGELRFNDTALNEEAFADERFAFDFRRRVAFIFQNPDVQLFNPTVFDEVAFGPLQLRWPKAEIIERVHEALRRLDIERLKDRAPHRLSGGEKKRVALASVLVLDPDVLLLDEPTAALDPRSQSQIIDFLVGQKGAKTVVTATHDLSIVPDIADRCIVFESGRVASEGTPTQVLEDEPLLRRAHLLYGHRHRHTSGLVHSHPHLPGRHHHEDPNHEHHADAELRSPDKPPGA